MFLRKILTHFNLSFTLSIISIFFISSLMPLNVSAATDAFNPTASHDAFSVPDKTVKKSVTGVDSGKYELVVDNSTITQSLLSDKGIIDLNIEFASGSAKLTDIAKKQIEQISIALKSENLKDENILIIGHTDNVGSAPANQKLSEKRALQVKKALITSGIAEIRLKSLGRGESKPLADNLSAAGRARNRRVTLSRIKN
jgi:outer membrane protein OmpA-like peptidoglycan-associated protein